MRQIINIGAYGLKIWLPVGL
jgi:hypothetical protein